MKNTKIRMGIGGMPDPPEWEVLGIPKETYDRYQAGRNAIMFRTYRDITENPAIMEEGPEHETQQFFIDAQDIALKRKLGIGKEVRFREPEKWVAPKGWEMKK